LAARIHPEMRPTCSTESSTRSALAHVRSDPCRRVFSIAVGRRRSRKVDVRWPPIEWIVGDP
jgi:hypothetical protein